MGFYKFPKQFKQVLFKVSKILKKSKINREKSKISMYGDWSMENGGLWMHLG